ncbi:DoxX family protein [Kribbella kalugense]|uniref:Putative oxidoreductase n=1 Tax=Kribbella kalugense TaxID=2512221 RepID=A0A4R7ZNC1_9ACTN|nr:DoxX family protein [Kribbella kalugense]TDW18985.1 putative oxidoreductase [Kribbella kalugense]
MQVFERFQKTERFQREGIGVFRIVVGFLFATHGAAALFGVLGTEQAGLFVWPSWWASLIQAVGGALVMIGLGTRYAALLCSGSMAFAYFTVHQSGALLPVQNGGEKAALFCFAFLLIAVLGNGAWSVEQAARTAPQQATAAAE